MNYIDHYNRLIKKARNREIIGYTEKHHIIPRCMNGSDDTSNIVRLTPEEHYVAHQLLIKIYPDNYKLINAAIRMLHHPNGKRNNKLYGWLKRKYQNLAKQRVGNKNGSYGKPWYYDPITKENGKFIPGHEPEGWIKGRTKQRLCKICNSPPATPSGKLCQKHLTKGPRKKEKIATISVQKTKKLLKFTECIDCDKSTNSKRAKRCLECRTNFRIKNSSHKCSKIKPEYTDNEKINALRMYNGHIRKALFSLGLNDSGAHYRIMKKLKELL